MGSLRVLLSFSVLAISQKFSFQSGSDQCTRLWTNDKSDGSYNFKVDCSNRWLDSIPSDLPDLATSLYLNGNRLRKLIKGSFDKLTLLQTLDLSGNDIATIPEGIFDRTMRLKKLDLRRNRLHCDWKIWWLVNFTQTLDQFDGYCFSPLSLRGKDIRQLKEADVIVNCISEKKLHKNRQDGIYVLQLAGSGGRNIDFPVYCHGMDTETPKEYLTLPSGLLHNHVTVNSNTCQTANGSSNVSRISVEYSFSKIRISLENLVIFPDDLTFASSNDNISYGYAGMCGFRNTSSCFGGGAVIDLRGTPFKIKDSVSWQSSSPGHQVKVKRLLNGVIVNVTCDFCGTCSPSDPLGLELIDAENSPYDACTLPLGIQNGKIKDRNISASSFLGPNMMPYRARLYGRGAWCADKDNRKQYIQVDLGQIKVVSGISLQGYSNKWVKSFKLKYAAVEGDWTEYQKLDGSPKILPGNTDSDSVVTHWFLPRLRARYVRLRTLSWYKNGSEEHRICLRFELYGCNSDVSSYIVKLGAGQSCMVPVGDMPSPTEKAVKVAVHTNCTGSSFLFHLTNDGVLRHTKTNYCLNVSLDSVAVLTKECTLGKFTFQRIPRHGTNDLSLIMKDTVTGKCARLKKAKHKNKINIRFKKCSDGGFTMLSLTRKGTIPLKPFFIESRTEATSSMWKNITFSCMANSDPPSVFVWTRYAPLQQGGIKLTGDNVKYYISKDNSLHLRNVSWNDRGPYFCNAVNSEGYAVRQILLTVKAVQWFTQIPSDKTIIAGNTVNFVCRTNGIPQPKLIWKFKRGALSKPIKIHNSDQRRQIGDEGTLTITKLQNTDEGTYLCISKSPGLVRNISATLIVYVPPRITLSSKSKDLFVGQSSQVMCRATGDPYAAPRWYRVHDDDSRTEIIQNVINGKIQFNNAQKKDEGMYVCESKNRVGVASEYFQLTVTATCNLDYIGYAHVTPDKAVFTEKEKVKIKCHKGFQLNGTSSLECTRHGNWSHVFPKCADIDECKYGLSVQTYDSVEGSGASSALADDEPDVCHLNAICINSVGSFSCVCEEGYIGDGFTCNWRPTTTARPPTTPTTTQPTTRSSTTLRKTTKPTTRKTTEEQTTTLQPQMLPEIFNRSIANFTYGVIPESQLLDDALTFTAAVKMYSSANIKVQGLLLSLAALRVITNRVNKNDQENGITLSNVQAFSNVVSNMLYTRNAEAWIEIQKTTNGTVELMSMMESYSVQRLSNLKTVQNGNAKEVVAENLLLKVQPIVIKSGRPSEINIDRNGNTDVKVKLPPEVLRSNTLGSGTPTAITILYESLGSVLPQRAMKNLNKTNVASKVLSVSVNSVQSGVRFKTPVRLEFLKTKITSATPTCAFWNFNTSVAGGEWSNYGCYASPAGGGKPGVTCECNHLTNFAILDQNPVYVDRKTHGVFILTLSIPAVVGCGICIFFAFVTCMGHICCSNHMRSDRRIILINVCISIILGLTLFLGGVLLASFKLIKTDFAKWFCLALCGALQLFFIAFFSWMLAEAVHLFLSTRTVIDKGSGKLKLFYLLGWGLPAVVVGLSFVLIFYNKIRLSSWCWIDLSSYVVIALLGAPALILITITTVLYILVSKALEKNRDLLNVVVQRYTSSAVRCSALLLFLHTLTLVSIATYLTYNDSIIFHHLLAAITSIEGVFLVAYHCYLDKKQLVNMSSSKSKSSKKRQHTYSTKDTITYKDESLDDGKFLIRRPSKRSLSDSKRNSASISLSLQRNQRINEDIDLEQHYPDMYGTGQRPLSAGSSPTTPMMGPTGEAEEEELEMEERSSSEDIHEVANDTHITKEPCLTSFSEDELSNTMPRKPRNSSVSGSILSVETKSNPAAVQGIPVYFPAAPPHHHMSLTRPKKEKRCKAKQDSPITLRPDSGPDTDSISDISSELSSILKELESFSTDPLVDDINSSPPEMKTFPTKRSVGYRKNSRGPRQRDEPLEMTDIQYATGPPARMAGKRSKKTKDPGDGLHGLTDLYSSL